MALAVVLFISLLYARPFLSQRTLMGNLEPFPDTFHYLVPARSITEGKGPILWREEGAEAAPAVPPLYAIFLSPIFLFQDDPRWFYIVNVALIAGSGVFLAKTVFFTTRSSFLSILAVFLYLTNHFIRWIPTLAMSESLLLFLFSWAMWLLFAPKTQRRVALAAFLAVSLYATKFAAAPLTLAYGISFLLHLFHEKSPKEFYGIYVWAGLFATFFFLTWQQLYTSTNIVLQFIWQISSLIPGMNDWLLQRPSEVLQAQGTGGDFFSLSFFLQHFPHYMKVLFGVPGTFLWDHHALTSFTLGTSAFLGWIWSVWNKKTRLFSLSLIFLLLLQTLFMSTFAAFDIRYIITELPIIIFFSVYFVYKMSQIITRKLTFIPENTLHFFVSSLLILSVLLSQYQNFRLQIALNIKYQKDPWILIAIQEHDAFFQARGENPHLISALIPYHYDFFAQTDFALLPLSLQQDFARSHISATNTWGKANYDDLISHYTSLIESGEKVYLTNAGLGNSESLQRDFRQIQESFRSSQIFEGCLGSCNLYKLTLLNDGQND